MKNITDIKNRIKSIKDTAQITKAMELISIAKMRRANEKYQKNLNYYERVRSTIKDILKHSGQITHPYLRHRETKRAAFVVIASDTGMCGDYNHRVLNFALNKINAVKDEKVVMIIGQMANEFFRRNGVSPDIEFLYCAQDPTLDDARRITTDIVDMYDNDLIDEINVVYTRPEGQANVAAMVRLLPITAEDFADAPEETEFNALLEFEPTPKEVFDILVPQYVVGLAYSALVQSVRCEHSERQKTMSNATKNAGEMIEGLELEYHRARQEQITTELTEISSSKVMTNN
jgi:ATP synthase, F1 gamma subunit